MKAPGDHLKVCSYSLSLAGGREWQICADRGMEWLSAKLARVMELQPASHAGGRTLALVRQGREHGPENRMSPGLAGRHSWLADFEGCPESPNVIASFPGRGDRITDALQAEQALFPVVADVIKAGGLQLHAALLERNGHGILVAARGGTGKSTCCKRIPPPWEALCDDSVLVAKDGRGRYRLHPLPTWSEYLENRSQRTWNVQRHVPLSAIFFLRQAPADEAVPLGAGQAALCTYSSAEQGNMLYEKMLDSGTMKALRGQVLDNACSIAGATPAFVLRASLAGRFWEEIEQALSML